MENNDHDAIMERLDEVYEEVRLARLAIEYLEDHTNDQFLMANLGMIRKQIARTEDKVDKLLGRPIHMEPSSKADAIFETVPFD